MSMINEISITSTSSSSDSTPTSSPRPKVVSISPTPWSANDSSSNVTLRPRASKVPSNITDSLGTSNGVVAAQFGYYDIRFIVGIQKVKFQGKIRKIAEVEWCRSILDFENITIYDQPSIAYGISPEAKLLLRKLDPNTILYTDAPYECRFCKTTLHSRSEGIAHEKGCTVPGGPGHKCKSSCPRSCRGKGVYVSKVTRKRRVNSLRYSQPKGRFAKSKKS